MSVRARGISVAIAGLVAFGVWFFANRDSDTQELKINAESVRAIEPESDDERLRSAINAAEKRIGALERRIHELETQRKPAEVEDSEAARESSDEEPERTKEEIETAKQERIDEIDSSFADEKVEKLWAADTENDLAAAFDKGNFDGSYIDYLECRSTFCRLSVKHENQVARRAFEGIADFVHMGGVVIPIESDGELRSVAYFIRKEYDKPQHPTRRKRQRELAEM